MNDKDTVLGEAFKVTDVVMVARELGIDVQVGKMMRSPFRDDQKPSFMVFKHRESGLHVFRDYARDDKPQGAWQFLALARPDMSKRDRALLMIRLAGLDPQRDKLSKSQFKALSKEVRKEAYKSREQDLKKVAHFPPLKVWPDEVSNVWKAGALDASGERALKIAAARGWPAEAMEPLIALDLIAAPVLPWNNEHHVAFKVEQPVYVAGRAGEVELVPVGYHQRVSIRGQKTPAAEQSTLRGAAEDGGQKPSSKMWLFVPYMPKGDHAGRPYGEFQMQLKALGRTVHPLPFVVGSLQSPKLVVICEGQWDAITFALASGWLSDACENPPPCFGLRGASSTEVFLAFYGRWLAAHRPIVLIVGDNDPAGKKLAERKNTEKIHEEFSFVDRLEAAGASRVVFQTIHPKYGKDFNDFYKLFRPGPGYMAEIFRNLKLEI